MCTDQRGIILQCSKTKVKFLVTLKLITGNTLVPVFSLHYDLWYWIHAGIQKVFSEGVQVLHHFFFSFFYEGKNDLNTSISGPSSARQQNAIWMAFCWRAHLSPKLNAGLVALWFFRGSGPVLLENPIFFVIFSRVGGGGGFGPPVLPLYLGMETFWWPIWCGPFNMNNERNS